MRQPLRPRRRNGPRGARGRRSRERRGRARDAARDSRSRRSRRTRMMGCRDGEKEEKKKGRVALLLRLADNTLHIIIIIIARDAYTFIMLHLSRVARVQRL